jgi:hypothetical protein
MAHKSLVESTCLKLDSQIIPNSTVKNRFWASAALGVFALLGTTAAHAGFTGYYEFSNWTQNNAPGSSILTDSPGAGDLTLRGPTAISMLTYTIQAETTGTWFFDWAYATTDIVPPSNIRDNAGYLLYWGSTPVPYMIIRNDISPKFGASPPIEIARNAEGLLPTIGFYVEAKAANNFRGVLTISDFNIVPDSTSVPEPPDLLMFGTAGLIISLTKRRLTTKKGGR